MQTYSEFTMTVNYRPYLYLNYNHLNNIQQAQLSSMFTNFIDLEQNNEIFICAKCRRNLYNISNDAISTRVYSLLTPLDN